jgi:hypothetical protein
MFELYPYSLLCLHSMVLNQLSTETGLPFVCKRDALNITPTGVYSVCCYQELDAYSKARFEAVKPADRVLEQDTECFSQWKALNWSLSSVMICNRSKGSERHDT